LVGSAANDSVGSFVTALTNGNYVTSSAAWNSFRGAVTWGNGSNGNPKGAVSSSNSLVGSSANDEVGYNVLALNNGDYVTSTQAWNGNRGAVTWGTGNSVVGTVSSGNSLVGSNANDSVGHFLLALSNGNYAATAAGWDLGATTDVGAIAWGNGISGTKGMISTSNSTYGQAMGDSVSDYNARAVANGNYIVQSRYFSGSVTNAGAVTLLRGNTTYPGPVTSKNSVFGMKTGDGDSLVFDYSPTKDQLVVGRPYENIVSLLRVDEISRGDFDVH
jgi:hypothetical protein